MSAEEREKGMEPNREQAELVASNILGLKEPYKYSDAGRQIMVLLDAKDRLLSEANANFSEARTTANLYYRNIQAKEEIIASLTAQLSEAQKEVERLQMLAKCVSPDEHESPAPQPKDSEAVRTVDELNKIGQDFWKEYMSMISMEAHPTTAAGRLHELWFDVLRHERERKA